MSNGKSRKTCFVIMGFGQKTDFQANPQRVLDLDQTFRNIIEPAVVKCGLECLRADKIIHSTVIDKPMYERLQDADLVIADLSTANANAIYELGVRHALKPHTTIVMAEKNFAFPFDLNHLTILKYTHLGPDIGYNEVNRVRRELQKKIKLLVDKGEVDSPVFMFLPHLQGKSAAATPEPAPTKPAKDEKSVFDLREAIAEAKSDVKHADDWLAVIGLLNRLKKSQPNDPQVLQELALATYKSKQPNPTRALEKAKEILEVLGPDTSVDAETVGLWGAIHKRLWDLNKSMVDLDRAVRSYARGYFIKNDYYNAINFAFLLNVRASKSAGDEAIADRVMARRIRNEVLSLCNTVLSDPATKPDDRFWAEASKVEAFLGLGRRDEAEALKAVLLAVPVPGCEFVTPRYPVAAQWMIDAMEEQLKKLLALDP
jgi:hypothetical protein